MATNKSQKANRINIVDPVYACLLTDTAEGTTYGGRKKSWSSNAGSGHSIPIIRDSVW